MYCGLAKELLPGFGGRNDDFTGLLHGPMNDMVLCFISCTSIDLQSTAVAGQLIMLDVG